MNGQQVTWPAGRLAAIGSWLTALALMLGACGPAAIQTPAAPGGRLRVVATFSILGDFVKNVAGDDVQLVTLVGPDSDTHSFEPSPADSKALADADLVFENGLGFEAWLNGLYIASGSTAPRVVVTVGVDPGKITVGPEAGETDPHVWQDVGYSIDMVGAVREALVAQDPGHAAGYQSRAAAYLQQLHALDTYVQQQAETLPAERRTLVTNHDALGYFARRYGFVVVGDVLGSVSTEAGEPAAADLARLADEIRAAQVPAIFTENVENSQVIEQIAQEAGVRVAPALYTDALGRAGSPGATYLGLMRYNIDTIVAALK